MTGNTKNMINTNWLAQSKINRTGLGQFQGLCKGFGFY